ncbi:SDR family oxidoreductase [Streptomyces sp. AP-93]|nr:SDR family oxidoreductase [Streptomyces sp. AP-93]MCJ0873243.1 SDR family oxidoreductase [Streptomyces sp. AP-93]
MTGAASGIGRYVAQTLAARGTSVVALDIDEAGLRETATASPRITTIPCDVTDLGAVTSAAGQAQQHLGPLDRVVHCAGIEVAGRLLDQPLGDIHRVMDVNYFGTVNVARATVPAMVERGRGEIALIASIGGWVFVNESGAYSASKAAIIAFSEVLASETRGSGVRVVCVCPAVVETPMVERMRNENPHLVGSARGSHPRVVLDDLERALARGRHYAFPGRGATTLWRARRHTPRLVDAIIQRTIRKST